jgi:uncharacterized damage-inducible protein DinB
MAKTLPKDRSGKESPRKAEQVEPWLRGGLTEFDPLRRGVLHALELASEDIGRWSEGLSHVELEARPYGLPSVGFQMRHMVRSLDRLLTYAEGRPLDEKQLRELQEEMVPDRLARKAYSQFAVGMHFALERVKRFSVEDYAQPRGVGRKLLPTTVGGLLVHCADHTQRHAGQAVTTAKVVLGMRALG